MTRPGASSHAFWISSFTSDQGCWDERVPILKATPNARIRFLSLEPLLGPLGEIDLTGIDWVIVGGESGDGYRQMHGDWAREIRDQCLEQKVHFFFKQWGGFPKSKQGRLLDGLEHNDWPVVEQSHKLGYPMPVRL